MNESKKLAAELVGLSWNDLNAEAIEKTKGLVLDQLGIQLAVSTKPWSLAAYKYARDFGGVGSSTVVHYGDKLRAENAAFANATFGHGFELDDCYLPGNSHPGCIVIPASLAIGEDQMIDGKQFLVAVVAGYEAVSRISRSVAPTCNERGFHAANISAPFGAAVATARILGFDAETMLNAISIAASHSSGLGEYSQSGGSVKRVHAGIAAFGGIRAAMLARAGITGPPTILEGKKGFGRAFSDKFRPEDLSARPGDGLLVTKVGLKQFCSCFQIQAPYEATARLLREHRIQANDIEEIIMGTSAHAIDQVGKIAEPNDITAAQFSARFGLAMLVVKGGNGFRDYTEANLADTDIKEMVKRVRLEVDKEVEANFPAKRAIRMTIRLKSGTVHLLWLEGARGTPENPMTWADIKEKFTGLASVVLPDRRVEELADAVANLENLGSINTLAKLLVA